MTEEYALRISGSGTINGTAYEATGEGRADPGSGDIAFSADFSAAPEGVDLFANLLAVIIIPTVIFGREDEGTRNLLSLAGGEIQFKQTVAGRDVEAISTGEVFAAGDKELVWQHTAIGRVDLSRVVEVEPFTAVMLPQGPGAVADVLAMPLITDKGRTIVHIVRTFSFRSAEELEVLQLRDIRVRSKVDGLRVEVELNSTIRKMTSLEDA